MAQSGEHLDAARFKITATTQGGNIEVWGTRLSPKLKMEAVLPRYQLSEETVLSGFSGRDTLSFEHTSPDKGRRRWSIPLRGAFALTLTEDRLIIATLGKVKPERTYQNELSSGHLSLTIDPNPQPYRNLMDPALLAEGELIRNPQALTRREQEIFDLIISGATSSEISQKLGVNFPVINWHRNKINSKLGLEGGFFPQPKPMNKVDASSDNS